MSLISRGLLAAMGISLAFSTLVSRVPLNQTDVWLHLAFGLQWLDSGGVDPAGIVPTSMAGAPGLNSYWLSQSVIALAWQAGGVAGIQALHSLAILARLAALGLLLKACGVPDRRLVLVVLVTLGLAMGHAPVFRPQVLAEVFAAPFLVMLLWPGKAWWPWVCSGFLLGAWGLFHGSFLMGIPLAGMVALGQCVQGTSAYDRLRFMARFLAMAAIALGSLVLVHPSGINALGDAMAMGANRAVRLQDEWRPLLSNQSPVPLLLWVASLAWWGWGMMMAGRKEQVPWACLIPGLFLAFLPLFHQRLLVWWYLAVPILVARAFRPEQPVPFPVSWRPPACLAVMTGLALVASGPINALARKLPDRDLMALATPVALAEGLAGAVSPLDSSRPHGRVFASESLGDYLAWRWKPRAPVLLHSHVHLLPPAHYDACIRVKWALPGWEAQLDHWGADLVLVETQSHPQLCARLRQKPGWTILQDEAFRRDLPDRARLFVAVRESSPFMAALKNIPLR